MTSAVQAYSYAGPSTLVGDQLGLSTSGGRTATGLAGRPRFFSGVVTQAVPAALGLLALADVAPARYHQPRAGGGSAYSRDPVITCDGERLRLESFSACGGVYARLDLMGQALDGEVFGRGTTNVDVNGPLREALARVGGRDPLHLGVGADELAVTTMDGAVIEKKVPLPERWLRGFAEVQVIASGFDLRAEASGMAAVRLGTAGRVGYDLADAGHFHRELPYDREHVEILNPRLSAARALVAADAVGLTGPGTAQVTTAGGVYTVGLDQGSCTCPWWLDHRGSRGPCKHVLATRITARAAEGARR
ncbi:SWIM zinc finger family protein [Sphaerisporangium album]|uniref:SWIM zinc finger family protein n=1 Tax=Sphaerisporangium album TaxID=509200 RepID=A0A367EQ37_9ACTN|nr:SWIM zinc finger family protein [Sphaerisporangium album]RCG20204.1 SWIM zinc finger family protein [Sphaerisporangium album]